MSSDRRLQERNTSIVAFGDVRAHDLFRVRRSLFAFGTRASDEQPNSLKLHFNSGWRHLAEIILLQITGIGPIRLIMNPTRLLCCFDLITHVFGGKEVRAYENGETVAITVGKVHLDDLFNRQGSSCVAGYTRGVTRNPFFVKLNLRCGDLQLIEMVVSQTLGMGLLKALCYAHLANSMFGGEPMRQYEIRESGPSYRDSDTDDNDDDDTQ